MQKGAKKKTNTRLKTQVLQSEKNELRDACDVRKRRNTRDTHQFASSAWNQY